jgi:outer membrane protein assembly factor BamB
MNMKLFANLFLCLSLWAGSISAEDWPRFRGIDGTGVAPDNPGLPTNWSTTENVKWVANVPGWGWSCPVVWGDRIFLTSVIADQKTMEPSKGLYQGEGVRDPAPGIHRWMVYCFDLNTGTMLWQREAHVGQPQVPRHPKSTYAAETPTTDGLRLYVMFGDLGLWCYDLEGKLLWQRNIAPKKTEFDYGAASSPVVHDGRVIVVYDNLEESWIASFDSLTGDEKWRMPRDELRSWSTPLIWTNPIRTEIVVPGERSNRGYSLDGQLLWEFNGNMGKLVIPSPFVAHGLCYLTSGLIIENHRPTFALRPGAIGNIAPDGKFTNNDAFAWYKARTGPYNTSQIVYGDYLYTLYDQGFLTCHHARTGEEVYGKKRFSPSGIFIASPFAYNGKLFCLSEDGLTYVIQPGPEFEILHRNPLDELCLSSPAMAGDKLLIRTATKLYCLSESGTPEADRKKAVSK